MSCDDKACEAPYLSAHPVNMSLIMGIRRILHVLNVKHMQVTGSATTQYKITFIAYVIFYLTANKIISFKKYSAEQSEATALMFNAGPKDVVKKTA